MKVGRDSIRFAPEDRWLLACMGALLVTAFSLMGINLRWTHYTGVCYFPRQTVALVFPALELAAFGHIVRDRDPRAGFIAINSAYFLMLAGCISIMTTGIQYTPFPSIDAALVGWDWTLGVDVSRVLGWTNGHPALRRIMVVSYPALNVEIFVLPLLATLFVDRRRTRVFLYALAYSYLAGGLIYYFFPSSGPAAILPSPHYSAEQYLTYWKYRQVHSRQEIDVIRGGMVAFPSFHCVWAMLLTYAARASKSLFYPVAALNALVILSTVLLAWHFLVDVAASAVLVAASLAAAEATHRRLEKAAP